MREVADRHVAHARSIQGCQRHGYSQDRDDPLVLIFVEEWTDMSVLRDHLASAQSQAFAEAAARLGQGARLRIFEASLLRAIGDD